MPKSKKPKLMTADEALGLMLRIDDTLRPFAAERLDKRLDEIPDYAPHTERFIEKFGDGLSFESVRAARRRS